MEIHKNGSRAIACQAAWPPPWLAADPPKEEPAPVVTTPVKTAGWDEAKAAAALAVALECCDRAVKDAGSDPRRRAADAYRAAVARLAERHDPYLFSVLPDLDAAFAVEQGVPKGARLFFSSADARPCWPGGPIKDKDPPLYFWTWEGGPGWICAADRPPPPHAPALWPRHRRRCPGCDGRDLGVSWQTCVSGEKRLRIRCGACRAHVAYLALRPDNPELEWRAS
jgi:hypothetical protein